MIIKYIEAYLKRYQICLNHTRKIEKDTNYKVSKTLIDIRE